jgi:uncharacterized Rmd1/YagE family protein
MYYFDMFQHKKHKCHQKIPETLVFQYGVPIFWFFNSQKEKDKAIMAKSLSDMNENDIIKQYAHQREY